MTTSKNLIASLLVAFAVAGCGGEKAPSDKATGTPTADAPPPPAASSEAGVVNVTVDGTGFHPDRIQARAGEPITLAITRTTDETCGTEILMPALGIDRKLPLNEKVEITVTPTAKGEIAFACGMDMLKGTIVVD
jgi:membrane fusion protein, copper/silver efflux system